MLRSLSQGIDALVGLFSPEQGVRRMMAREVIGHARRLNRIRQETYAAAKTNRLVGPWSPGNSNINDVIGASSSTVRARVRQLVRDFPYFARAVNIIVDYVVGSGITYQARVQDGSGKLNRKLNQRIEDAVNRWADEADISGKLHFYEMMRLSKRQDVESGEFLLVKTRSDDRRRYLPFCLQAYETDWLSSNTLRGVVAGSEVEQGIEYNAATGRVLAYHLTDPDAWGKTKRISADRVIHGFDMLRPGQLRGISPLAPGVLVAHSLREYMEAEIDAAKMASKYLALIKTASPNLWQGNAPTDPETGKKIEELENAIIQYMRPGEEVTFAQNPRPGDNFPPFVRLVLCMLAVTAGIPYELLSGNYEDINYSTARTIRNDFSQQLRPVCRRHVLQFGQPIVRDVISEAWLFGKLDLPGFAADPHRYFRSEWQPPGMESLDPQREGKAHADAVSSLLRSPQEIVRGRGRELEDVYKEIADANALADELGLQRVAVNASATDNTADSADQETEQ